MNSRVIWQPAFLGNKVWLSNRGLVTSYRAVRNKVVDARKDYRFEEAHICSLQTNSDYQLLARTKIPAELVDVGCRDLSAPAGFRNATVDEGIYNAWDIQLQARSYDMQMQVQGEDGWWSSGPVYPYIYANYFTWCLEGCSIPAINA